MCEVLAYENTGIMFHRLLPRCMAHLPGWPRLEEIGEGAAGEAGDDYRRIS